MVLSYGIRTVPAVVMIVSFAALDPDLLRERMRPDGKKPPSLRVFSLVLFMHWIVAGLDRGRFHWSDNVPDWLQGVCLFTVADTPWHYGLSA